MEIKLYLTTKDGTILSYYGLINLIKALSINMFNIKKFKVIGKRKDDN